MSCECASLRMEVLSQKSDILSQRALMVQWFETLMTELQDVKKQNSKLKELFKASNHHHQESMVVHSAPTILEGFSANGSLDSLETNRKSVQDVLECQPEFPQETSNPFVKLFEVAPELEEGKLLVETGLQLTEDDQKIFPPEIEPAEVNSEFPLLQLERFESATIDNKETCRAFDDTSTVPKNKSKAVHRTASSSPKQDLDAARGNKPTTRNIGKYRCVKSPYQTWNPSTLKAQSVTHTGERPFQCSVCNKGLASKTALLSHILTHTGKKPFECTICKKSFARKEHFMRHNLIHTGEKPFSCDVCDYRCRHSSALFRHKMTHTGEKPFECDQCDYRSNQRINVTSHRRIHTGEKPFQCDMCDYRTAEKGNLIRHKKLLNHEK